MDEPHPWRSDEAAVRRLDDAWNEAYRQHNRLPLGAILADDFDARTTSGGAVTKASLMVDPPGRASSVLFSDQAVHVFGDTAISRGRLRLELDDRTLDQRFMRVFAKRGGAWRAVSVAVTPSVDLNFNARGNRPGPP
jgi:ketosteroid isomerase-like protein